MKQARASGPALVYVEPWQDDVFRSVLVGQIKLFGSAIPRFVGSFVHLLLWRQPCLIVRLNVTRDSNHQRNAVGRIYIYIYNFWSL